MASAGDIVVAFLSLSTESCVDQFIERLNTNHRLRCIFVKLTHRDLQSFVPKEEYDAVVLLHSISQGRNSITDVADAKYNKLLPQLKGKYGPDRVGVIVHSMTSYNPVSRTALMMVFKKSQPTAFQCSNCVIQCNNPAKMEDEHFSRLTDFLENAPHHEKPKPLLEGPPSPALSGAKLTDTNILKASSSSEEIPVESTSKTCGVIRQEISSSEENSAMGSAHSTGEEIVEQTTCHTGGEMKTISSPAATDILMELEDSKVGIEVSQDERSNRNSSTTIDMPPTQAGKGGIVSPLHPLSQHSYLPPVSMVSTSSGAYPDKADGGYSSGPSRYRKTTPTDYDCSSAALGYHRPVNTDYGQAASANTQPSLPLKSTVEQHAENMRISQQKIINEKGLALAFLDLSRSGNHTALKTVKNLFPQRTLMSFEDWKKLKCNWHLYTAILIDVGRVTTLESYREFKTALMGCMKNMYDEKNVAILLPVIPPGNISEYDNSVYQLALTARVYYFHYCPESRRFGEDEENKLVHWLSDCCFRH